MNRSKALFVSLCFAGALALVAGACGTEPNPVAPGDGGAEQDAGAVIDAGGQADAGLDAGEDAGLPDAGGDAGALPDAGLPDAGPADSGVPDAGVQDAGFEGVQCGNAVCTGSDVCCGSFTSDGGVDFTCAASCPDAGVMFTCDGPEDCANGSPVCCGQMTTGPGTFPNCSPDSVTATCSATCSPSFSLSCNSTTEIVRCHARADCAAFAGYPECCSFSQAATAGSFCVSQLMAQFGNPTSCAP